MHLSLAERTQPLTLQAALLVYANANQQLMLRGTFETRGDDVVITGAVPITESLREQLLAEDRRQTLTYIPPQVVAVNTNACAWFVPAQPRVMQFSSHSDASLNALSGRSFPQPPLVMISNFRNLHVFALERNERPMLDTPLLVAPYYNVHDGGSVCLGSTKHPKGSGVTEMQAWETAFYSSNFTHRSGSTPRQAANLTHTELWLAAEQKGTFDPAWLNKAAPQTTLQQLLS